MAWEISLTYSRCSLRVLGCGQHPQLVFDVVALAVDDLDVLPGDLQPLVHGADHLLHQLGLLLHPGLLGQVKQEKQVGDAAENDVQPAHKLLKEGVHRTGGAGSGHQADHDGGHQDQGG